MDMLKTMQCTTPTPDTPALDEADIQRLHAQVTDWSIVYEDGVPRLRRTFKLKNFQQALDFTVAIGEISEEQDHHPLIELTWGRVTATWWTHAINGLHQNDFIMAARVDDIFSRWA